MSSQIMSLQPIKLAGPSSPRQGGAEGEGCVALRFPILVAGFKGIIIPPQPMSPGCEMTLIHASIEFPPLDLDALHPLLIFNFN